jgi:hypothetical protein
MARGDFLRRRCKVILVGWWIVIFNTNTMKIQSAASRLRSQLRFLSLWLPRPTRLLCRSMDVDQGGGTSRDDGRALSGAAGISTYNSYWGYPA